jgi:pimeloyl-ACP methyl ester carboxylesterase
VTRPLQLAAVATLALLAASCGLVRWAYGPPPLPANAEKHLVQTTDGWDVSLIHYAAKSPRSDAPEEARRVRRPVLLLHGIVTNQRNLDVDERHSFARWLSAQGIDSWSLSLRGTGDSQKPQWIGGEKKWDWDFDAYATQDLPAAIAYVRAKTGAPRLDYIGHSLGGMTLYAMLARKDPQSEGLAAAVTLGSPCGFRWGPRFTAITQSAAKVGGKLPLLTLNAATLFALPFLTWYPAPMALIFYNPANIDPEVWSQFLAVGVDDASPALARQAARWIETDRFTSADGSFDYLDNLAGVKVPVLVVAAKLDQLGFPPLVRRCYDALGGPKEWKMIGEENGASADYGHMDLLLGERAPEDVFTPVVAWLAER